MDRLVVLGTGAANALRYYNTCFMLQGPQGGLLVDGGGGNGILVQLAKADIPLLTLTDVFVTHAHVDHSLGIIWIVRMVSSLFLREKRSDILRIHCHARLAERLRSICQFTLSEKQFAPVGTSIRFVPVERLPPASHRTRHREGSRPARRKAPGAQSRALAHRRPHASGTAPGTL